MKSIVIRSALASAVISLASAATAQDAETTVSRGDMIKPEQSTGANAGAPEPAPMKDINSAAEATTIPVAEPTMIAEPAAPEPVYKTASDGSTCELHVWPTENYLGIQMGLLSGFGLVGALADGEVHKGRVKTVKDLMREYLGPDVQMQELEKLEFAKSLGLDGYKIIVQEPTPWNEDLKDNPELKAQVKEMNKTMKAGLRLSDSSAPCYAELVTTHIFYHKAMMYGSNLFTGWQFREFAEGKEKAVFTGKGQVKNPLEEFPPKSEDMIETAKLELRDAYAKDFTEYVEKKVMKKKNRKRR